MPSACPDFNVERFLQLCFLLLLACGSSHGDELLEEIRKTWFRHEPLDVGLVYRNLRRMEGGLVGSEWIVGNSGPAKRVCCVTEKGHNALPGLGVFEVDWEGLRYSSEHTRNCFSEKRRKTR